MTENKYEQTFPSETFEEQTKIPGLCKQWILPRGLTADELFESIIIRTKGNWRVERNESAVIELHAELVTLNPELNEIDSSTVNRKVDIIMGALSRFNFLDIKFFTDMGDDIVKYNESNAVRASVIEMKCGFPVYWVMSPETMEYVEHLLGIAP